MCLGWQNNFLQSNLSKATPLSPHPPSPHLKTHKCKHACRVQLTLTELYWRSCQYFAKSCKVSFTVSDKTGITHWSSKFSYRIMSHEAVTSCTQCMALFLQSNPCSTNIYIYICVCVCVCLLDTKSGQFQLLPGVVRPLTQRWVGIAQ